MTITPQAFALTIALLSVVCLGIGILGGLFIAQKHKTETAKLTENLKAEYKEHRAEVEKWLKEVKAKLT